MKTELRLSPHSITVGANVVELWYNGEFIGQIVGFDGPGVTIISKHNIVPALPKNAIMAINTLDVLVNAR